MKKPVRIDSEADSELTAACEWYEQQCVGLGTELLEAIDETIARIVEYPGLARSSHRVSLRGRRRVVRCWDFRELGDAGVVTLR